MTVCDRVLVLRFDATRTVKDLCGQALKEYAEIFGQKDVLKARYLVDKEGRVLSSLLLIEDVDERKFELIIENKSYSTEAQTRMETSEILQFYRMHQLRILESVESYFRPKSAVLDAEQIQALQDIIAEIELVRSQNVQMRCVEVLDSMNREVDSSYLRLWSCQEARRVLRESPYDEVVLSSFRLLSNDETRLNYGIANIADDYEVITAKFPNMQAEFRCIFEKLCRDPKVCSTVFSLLI